MVMWMTCMACFPKGTWCDLQEGHSFCLKEMTFFGWFCFKLSNFQICLKKMFQVVSLILYHFVLCFPLCFSSCKDQASVLKRFVPSTEVDDESRSWPNGQSVHTSKSANWLKLCNVCHLQTFSRSSRKLRFRTPWSPRSSSWYPASMSLPTDGVLEIQVVELNTKIPRNDLLTLFTFQRRIHNGLREVHAPTARFVSKHPPQESLSNQRQKKHLYTSIAAPKSLFNSNSKQLFLDMLEFKLFRLIPLSLWLMQLPFHS